MGNFQNLGDKDAGLYQYINTPEFKMKGFEVLVFRVGNILTEIKNKLLPSDAAINPDIVYQHTLNIIQDRVARRGIFAGLPKVETVGVGGYSWGGGTADLLFGNEATKKAVIGSTDLRAVAYIDAVQLTLERGGGWPVKRRPLSKHFYNVYQENVVPWIRGMHIDGTDVEINEHYEQTHVTIDEKYSEETIKFLLTKMGD